MKIPLHLVLKTFIVLLVGFLFVLLLIGFITGLFKGWLGISTGVFLMVLVTGMLLLTSYGLKEEIKKEHDKL